MIETPITYGTGKDAQESGASRYEVRIGGALLVDELECRQLKVSARAEKVNQNDIDGLYDVYWVGVNNTLGEKFNFNSNNVTGLMKGLLEARDGNNANPFSGTIVGMNTNTASGSTATIFTFGFCSFRYLPTPESVPPVPTPATNTSTVPSVSCQISGPVVS